MLLGYPIDCIIARVKVAWVIQAVIQTIHMDVFCNSKKAITKSVKSLSLVHISSYACWILYRGFVLSARLLLGWNSWVLKLKSSSYFLQIRYKILHHTFTTNSLHQLTFAELLRNFRCKNSPVTSKFVPSFCQISCLWSRRNIFQLRTLCLGTIHTGVASTQ